MRRRAAWRDTRARIDAILDAPAPAQPSAPAAPPERVSELSLHDVTAAWPGGAPVLHGVTATARRGAGWLVVRGPSGSGKSTLLAVLMASLRPSAGEYRLDGVSSTDLTGTQIRRHLAWCPQDPHIFASTIRANLLLGLPEGTTDADARLWTVLREVGLAELVAALPDGLDTHVGSGGTRLSGGERRRLAVARTLLTGRDVVLLDEPTAHLDPPTARTLIADLRHILRDRTVVCVTHDATVVALEDSVLDLTPAPARLSHRDRASRPVRQSSGDHLRHRTPRHQPLDA
jgi:ATP-binding cassette subfamily C protein CydCD